MCSNLNTVYWKGHSTEPFQSETVTYDRKQLYGMCPPINPFADWRKQPAPNANDQSEMTSYPISGPRSRSNLWGVACVIWQHLFRGTQASVVDSVTASGPFVVKLQSVGRARTQLTFSLHLGWGVDIYPRLVEAPSD
ncbi:hypothetical protein BaRGS_00035424 [Batillaria attramentaria]|uniref:Uncharacterized protein n=1 Tax=Batillaria attramentaria TaxID=370345 RepID=A0ABD0JEV7_9CAEN